MSVFQFKKFKVVNERSAMKVNTDGVLLGAAMTIKAGDRRLLDIGTGTGTIALMAAQRVEGIPGRAGNDAMIAGNEGMVAGNEVVIDAIDVDEPSASEAGMNFKSSTCRIGYMPIIFPCRILHGSLIVYMILSFPILRISRIPLPLQMKGKARPDILRKAFHIGIYSNLPRTDSRRRDAYRWFFRPIRRRRLQDTQECADSIFSA